MNKPKVWYAKDESGLRARLDRMAGYYRLTAWWGSNHRSWKYKTLERAIKALERFGTITLSID